MGKLWAQEYPPCRQHNGGVKNLEIALPETPRMVQGQKEKGLGKGVRTEYAAQVSKRKTMVLSATSICTLGSSTVIEISCVEATFMRQSLERAPSILDDQLRVGGHLQPWDPSAQRTEDSPMTCSLAFVAGRLGRLFPFTIFLNPMASLTADFSPGGILYHWE